MFIGERIYDIKELSLCNYHIHTNFSRCAKPEMVFEDIVAKAKAYGLREIAITDHSNLNDGIDVLADTLELKKRREQLQPGIKVYIGSELSAYGIGKYTENDAVIKELEYHLYSVNHFHMPFWDQPEERTPEGYAVQMIKVMNRLFEDKLADCIAHPFIPWYIRCLGDEDKKAVLDSITDNELGDIMSAGERAECSWELHPSVILAYPPFGRRYFNIGRENGVHFNFATDAHVLWGIETKYIAEDMEKIVR